MLWHCWNSAIKLKLGGGSEQRDQPDSSMILVMPRAQLLKPLYDRQAPPTSCSIMDNGLPLYDRQGPPASCSIMNIGLPLSQRRKAPVGRSKMKPLRAGSDPRGQPQSSMALVMPQVPVFEATLQQGGSIPQDQFLKPLYNGEAPPTPCSVIDSGWPLSMSRALRVGRSIAPKVVSG
jgi:hypothetical protein